LEECSNICCLLSGVLEEATLAVKLKWRVSQRGLVAGKVGRGNAQSRRRDPRRQGWGRNWAGEHPGIPGPTFLPRISQGRPGPTPHGHSSPGESWAPRLGPITNSRREQHKSTPKVDTRRSKQCEERFVLKQPFSTLASYSSFSSGGPRVVSCIPANPVTAPWLVQTWCRPQPSSSGQRRVYDARTRPRLSNKHPAVLA
jgi:hypothetical protein